MKTWVIKGDEVLRKGVTVARMTRLDGKLGWEGFDMGRYGFTQEQALLDDVKYFHRFRLPKLVLTFQSGRKVVYR